MRIKQLFCKHKNTAVEDIITEGNKTVMFGKCIDCGMKQITRITVVSNDQEDKKKMEEE